jgi:GntR family transcriptional regulator, transcriptional repressor for pyruvate dehydrogenase complex
MSYHKTSMSELFTPVSTGRVSADIVEQIKRAIQDGRLTPGDQLPSERELTKQLGVSRVSVRDALRMLEAYGLIQVRVGARGGAFVTAPAPNLVGEGMAHMLLLASVAPSDVTELRLIFELALLPLACERRTEEDLEELDVICDRAEATLRAGAYDVALSAEFHTRLAEATHNTAIALFAESFQGPLLASLRHAQRVAPEMGKAGLLEHRAVVDAIRARDADAARAIMSEHLERTARRVRSASAR